MKEFKHFLALTMVFAVLGIAIFSGLGLRERSDELCEEVNQDVFLHLEFKENFIK